MPSIGRALGAAFMSTARAEASRINGAKSRGPKTPEGKARSARNALKHGLRAERFTVVGDEDEDAFDAHEAALLDELAPAGPLQTILAERIARAAWRLRRADQIEAQLFDLHLDTDGDLGMAVIRDGNGTRAFETLLRYRAAADGQLLRALRTLKALQAEAAQAEALQAAAAAAPATAPTPKEPKARANAGSAGHDARPDPIDPDLNSEAAPAPAALAPGERPIEPDARGNPGEIAPAPPADEPRVAAQPPVQPDPARTVPQASRVRPIEPETREMPAERPSGRAPEPVAAAVMPIRHGGR